MVSRMKLHPQSLRHLVLLAACGILISVRESSAVFVPGRCLCPRTQAQIRARPLDFTVYPTSPHCDRVTVIVTLKRNNELVCLDPESRLGAHLVHCWNRAHRLARNPQNCLRRRRRKGRGRKGPHQRSLQRSLGHRRKATKAN
ncbi:C-X-C motif chemokine 10-like [Synchiropus picturatus]